MIKALHRSASLLALLAVMISASGCYHASVTTGEPMGSQTVDKAWASGWVLGLVPPKTIEAGDECRSGVAKVETQLSFANQLVSFLTGGIYTPMHVTVTCAS